MGFLSGLSGGLLGGSSGSGSSQSGFAMLPQEIQNAYKNYATQVNNQIPNALTAYKPMDLNAGEQNALSSMYQGFAPTQESLNSDLGMLMNPYNDYVINGLNRDANSNYSILKQDLNAAGQLGSNRQRLGANDIEQTRLNNIGQLRQNQYNQALGQVFNNLIPQRQQDAQNALGAGTYERNLGLQQNSAAITGLQQLGQALGILPNNGGSTSNQSSSSSNGLGGLLGGIGGFFG